MLTESVAACVGGSYGRAGRGACVVSAVSVAEARKPPAISATFRYMRRGLNTSVRVPPGAHVACRRSSNLTSCVIRPPTLRAFVSPSSDGVYLTPAQALGLVDAPPVHGQRPTALW